MPKSFSLDTAEYMRRTKNILCFAAISTLVLGKPALALPEAKDSQSRSAEQLGPLCKVRPDLCYDWPDLIVIHGPDEGRRAGQRIAYAGDVNGGGVPDLIVTLSNPNPDELENDPHDIVFYVVWGEHLASNYSGKIDLDQLGAGGVTVLGNRQDKYRDGVVSSAGDIDGDGLDDILLGEPGFRQDNPYVLGAAFFIRGSALSSAQNSVMDLDDFDLGMGVQFTLPGVQTRLGWSVSSAGDVDGDEVPDILIGNPDLTTDSGEAYLVWGTAIRSAQSAFVDLTARTQDRILITGSDPSGTNHWLGAELSKCGDIDKDGRDEFLIGAPDAYFGDVREAGKTYLFWGDRITGIEGGKLDLKAAPDGSITIFVGGEVSENVGAQLSCAQDINQDNTNDLLISGRTNRSYAVWGDSASPAANEVVQLDRLRNGVTISGDAVNGGIRGDISGFGDLDRDGLSDVLMSVIASNETGTDNQYGRGFVLWGQLLAFDDDGIVELEDVEEQSFLVEGGDLGDGFGEFVTYLGDLNGDGVSEVVFSGLSADARGERESGEIYIVSGARLTAPIAGDRFVEIAKEQYQNLAERPQ